MKSFHIISGARIALFLGGFVIFLSLGIQTARAIELSLRGDEYWVVLASRQTVDEAIGVARLYGQCKPIIVRAENGWFATICGPYTVKQGKGQEFLHSLITSQFLPSDAYLSRGARYSEEVWYEPKSPIIASQSYDGEHDAVFHYEKFDLTLSRVAEGQNGFSPTLTAKYDGKPAFNVSIADNPSDTPASQVSLVRLDPDSTALTVVFTYFWQGAHCCVATKFASLGKDGAWHLIDGEPLDGEGGYDFETINGSDFSYLISLDQSFLYAFDGYAGSTAPTRIHRLVGDKLTDVTSDGIFRSRLTEGLYELEATSALNKDSDSWHSNGFLAGWVASSMLVGQGESAWQKMLANYDPHSDFGPQKCALDNTPIEKCPQDQTIQIPFPIALKTFLVQHHYITDLSAYPIPSDATPVASTPNQDTSSTSQGSPKLQTCASANDTVRKLIYQTFIGRDLNPGETYDEVSLQDDITLEAYDANIQKATCAVTYEITLKPLVGILAEEGEMGRSALLLHLSRRLGGVASHRIKYTVKPTATPGTSFVELLP